MRICVFASGSSGNCLLLTDRNTNILIDAGISARRITSALAQQNLTVNDLDGVLITHEHSDHISGLKTLLRKSSVPVFAPEIVMKHLLDIYPDLGGCFSVLTPGNEYYIGSLSVRPFRTPHDTEESVGYRVTGENASFALATDLGHVTEEVLNSCLGADIALIEANHDPNMLRFGPYPPQLKDRIRSDHGHLSNEQCADFAGKLFTSGTGRIILGHLSRHNNTPETALRTVCTANSAHAADICCAPDFGLLVIESEP